MKNSERNIIKNKILKCLTEDFKNNQAIFDKKEGRQIFNGTDLEMVMDKVVKGLEFAKSEINKSRVPFLPEKLERLYSQRLKIINSTEVKDRNIETWSKLNTINSEIADITSSD